MELLYTARIAGESSSQYAYRVLQKNIMFFRLLPGQNLNEGEFQKILGVGRTPIREAFLKLRDERLIDVFPQKGSSVSYIDYALCGEGRKVRINIEGDVFAEACEKITPPVLRSLREILELESFLINDEGEVYRFLELDEAFHKTVYDAAGRSWSWQIVKTICSHFDRIRFLNIDRMAFRDPYIHKEHLQLYQMLEARESAKIADMVINHLWDPNDADPGRKQWSLFWEERPEFHQYIINPPEN